MVNDRQDGRVIRITQIDGKLPNLALMRLAAWHKSLGDDVRWQRGVTRQLDEPEYDIVYGSAIFSTSAKAVAMFRQQFPGAIVGGEGGDTSLSINDIVPTQFTEVDYGGHPDFTASIGRCMDGCRFKCGFCPVPRKEGAARSRGPISQVWRGEGHPKHIHLLDNDFFGNPQWKSIAEEITSGGYKVCINQGINSRLITDEQAEAVVAIAPWDDQFKRRRLYTAWDNIGDEKIFFEGVDRLERAGWTPDKIFTYMLVGYDRRETWERIEHRFNRMVERGIRPYPMVFSGDDRRAPPENWTDLKRFQRWVITGAYKVAPFSEYSTRRHRETGAPLFESEAA
jgi:hypothetical protein